MTYKTLVAAQNALSAIADLEMPWGWKIKVSGVKLKVDNVLQRYGIAVKAENKKVQDEYNRLAALGFSADDIEGVRKVGDERLRVLPPMYKAVQTEVNTAIEAIFDSEVKLGDDEDDEVFTFGKPWTEAEFGKALDNKPLASQVMPLIAAGLIAISAE